jgi:alpha-glucosidase
MDPLSKMAALSAPSADWWAGAVIYQIYPRSFQDSNGDGIGDLKGITSRLDHVKSLGADAIWISPFFKSPMADFGYDVEDYCAVDPMFGTLADFDALIAAAHRLGIKVIIDQVISHTSDAHDWFKESRESKDNPKADWYVWAEAKDDGTPPNNWLSVFGGSSWQWDTGRCQYYLHNFLASQPDLNFHCEEVQAALLDTIRFWLDRGVDGIRLDTVNYYFHDQELRSNPARPPVSLATVSDVNPYGRQFHLYDKTRPENLGFLKRLRVLLDEKGAIAMGEVGDEDRSLETMAAYSAGTDMMHMCYTFDMLGQRFEPALFRESIEGFSAAAPSGWPCWAFSNHDVQRHVTRWAREGVSSAHLAKLAIALLVSLRGQICLYNGEELGLPEAELELKDLQDPYGIRFWPKFKGRDGCRTPFIWEESEPKAGFTTGKPWLPVPADQLPLAASRQGADGDSVLSHYRRTIALRRTRRSLATGDIEFLDLGEDMLAFVRTLGSERTFCAFSFSKEPQEFEAPPGLAEGEVISASGDGGKSALAPFGWMILGLEGG